MIKKLSLLVTTAAILFFLAGCNEDLAADLTDAEEVLKQSLEAMENLNSYSMEMENEQTTTVNNTETVTMSMQMNADMTMEPLAFHQKIVMKADMMGEYESEMYFVDGIIHMFEPITNEWVKLSKDEMVELGLENLSELQLSPDQQLLVLRNFINDIQMTETSNEYILKLSGQGADFLELAKFFGGAGSELEYLLETFSQVELNNIEYEIAINKESYYQTGLSMLMELTMSMEGETIQSVSAVNGKIFSYNEIDKIVLPDQLKTN